MTVLASPDKETLREIFDHIAFRYDALNSLLSLSIDESWRERAARLTLKEAAGAGSILDLGVGTGKFLSRFLRKRSWRLAVGVDFSSEMLRIASRSLSGSSDNSPPPLSSPPGRGRGEGEGVKSSLIQADIHNLPFETESFDLIVSSFTLRSVKERPQFFSEILRLLTPGGRAAFLCLTRPRSFLGRALYAPYLKFYLPLVGGLLTRNPVAYHFLSESIQAFPSPAEIGKEMVSLGFSRISIFSFTFGLATLILAQR